MVIISGKTPQELGYRMPAEWEKQDAIWLSWPSNEITFEKMEEVEQGFLQFMKALHKGQIVNVLVNSSETEKKIKTMAKKAKMVLEQIHIHHITNVDVWFRDYGPAFVINPKAKEPLAMVKWTFNAWGDKYDDLKPDNNIPYEMNKSMNLPMFEVGIVLEGGSIDVNGAGCVLTTEQCLLNKNRNPKLSRAQIEDYLKKYLNVSKVLWLKDGIAGDDTDGHIDDIARFTSVDTIACAYEDDEKDENFAPLKENYDMLLKMTDANGKPFKVVKVPMPGEIKSEDHRLPASYLNFYIGNDAVCVPIFGHVNDKKALDIIQGLFPKHKVVGINCVAHVYGLGTLHCSSQQQPAFK
jgi:agmatine deiminase